MTVQCSFVSNGYANKMVGWKATDQNYHFQQWLLAYEDCELEIEIHKLRNYKKRHFLALYYHVHLLKMKVLDVQNSDWRNGDDQESSEPWLKCHSKQNRD